MTTRADPLGRIFGRHRPSRGRSHRGSSPGSRARRALVGFVAVLAVLGVAAEVAAHNGAVWNGSESLPFGLYWALQGPPSPVRPGDYVVVCAPPQASRLAVQRGYLPRDVAGRGCGAEGNPILKRIYAVAGDHFEVTAYGVTVNGALVHNSAPLRRDDLGRPLWNGRPYGGQLGPHQVLALSAYNPASYDSRYFGPLDERNVLKRVRPVLTAPYDERY